LVEPKGIEPSTS